ncbi:MAG: serine/threonine-protein kinase [Candidatus Margulisbacteria bacterium]|nr:serine/threonine-protein kinase [Candidatus Margulisiibacteriota bacterium]
MVQAAQYSLLRHPIRTLEARTADKPTWRKIGQAMKYIMPVLTTVVTLGAFFGSAGAATMTGLVFYLLLGPGGSTLASRGLSKSFKLAKADREGKALAQSLHDTQQNLYDLQRRNDSYVEKLRGMGVKDEEIIEIPFDGYNILKQTLGAGGMAIAFLVKNKNTGELRVFKVPRPELLGNATLLQQFYREAKSMMQFRDHPNVVHFLDLPLMTKDTYLELLRRSNIKDYEDKEAVGKTIAETNISYILMEYVPHPTLSALLLEHTKLPAEVAVKLAIDLAETLWHVNYKDIVHRDLKPDNVFVVPDEAKVGTDTVKVGDFGLAKQIETGPQEISARMTQLGEVKGTPQYMSPEQLRGEEVDWRTDQYALGIILFEMLTGRLPYQEDASLDRQTAFFAYAAKVMTGEMPDIRLQVPGISEALARIVERMIARTAGERFQSWEDCVNAMKNIDLADEKTALAQIGADGVPRRRK